MPAYVTYIAQIINFIVFVVILYFLLYKPVGRIMRERRDQMESQLREAEQKLAQARDLQAEAERQKEELEDRRDAILRETRDQAEQQRQELLQEAEDLARERLKRFRRVMEQERDELLGQIEDDLKQTILDVLKAVLGDASEAFARRGVERAVRLLDEMPEEEVAGARKAVSGLGGRVTVRSSGPLGEDEKQRLRSAVARRLGLEQVELEVEQDEELLAGLELVLGHVSLQAHWRGVVEEALQRTQTDAR